jgi:hypothetical protein
MESGEVSELRQRVRALFEQVYQDPACKLLHGECDALCMHPTSAAERTIDELLYIKRFDAKLVSGHPAIVGMLNLTGPRSGGKSLLAARMTGFLGLLNGQLGKSVPGTFLTQPPRADSEASQPVRAAFKGKKGIFFREMPAKPVVAETIKGLLDARDGMVEARANYSGTRCETAFPITFTMVGMSNTALTLDRTADTGLGGKLGEVQTKFTFVDRPQEVHERQARSAFASDVVNGLCSAEFFAWTRAFYCTLSADICKGRHIVPVPSTMRFIEEEVFEDTPTGRILRWKATALEACEPCEAAPYAAVVKAARAQLGAVSSTDLTGAGLGRAAHGQYRATGQPSLVFFFISVPGGRRPSRLCGAS